LASTCEGELLWHFANLAACVVVKEGREVIELLLRERTPEERQRLAEAWERVAGGDPDSLPAIYALADRFSLEAHAALLGETRAIHASLEGMAREIGQGATATVERTERAASECKTAEGRIAGLVEKLEVLAVSQSETAEQVRLSLLDETKAAIRQIREEATGKGRSRWMWTGLAALIGVIAGYWIGTH
jgi:hypothetical protein